MFHRLFKLPLISITFHHRQHSKTFNPIIFPLPDIRITSRAFPSTTPTLLASYPLPNVDLTIGPLIYAFTLFHSLVVISLIGWTIWKVFVAFSLFHVIGKITLIWSSIEIENNSKAIFISIC
jgi:hypothetical protein